MSLRPGQMTLTSPLPGGPGFPTQWAMESTKLLNSTWILQAYLLVFYCCHNKSLQTWQLKQYRFIILQLCKSEVHFGSGWAAFLSGNSREGLNLAFRSFWRRHVLPGPGLPSSVFRATSDLSDPLPSSHLSFRSQSGKVLWFWGLVIRRSLPGWFLLTSPPQGP